MKAHKLTKKLGIDVLHYEEICQNIKDLEFEKELLRKALIKSYFESKSTFENDNIVASYMPQQRCLFDSKQLKEANPTLYEQFTYIQTIYILSVRSKC